MTQKWLDTGCFLEGTPNAAEALQTSIITISADNGIGNFAMQTLVVGPTAPAFMDPIPNLTAEVGPRFEYRIPAGGPPMPTINAIGMPSWMSLIDGRLEGYPTQAHLSQVSSITVTALTGVGFIAFRTFTVTVIPQGATSPLIAAPTAVQATAAETSLISIATSGQPSPTLSASGTWPGWLTLSANGLSGKPPLSLSNGSLSVTLTAANGISPMATHTILISVDYNPKDVTKDKAIDVVDVQRLVNLILALSAPTYQNEGDVNADSAVDVVDVQAVVNKILNP